jgi:cytochrome d ubiquinol oxidase subunit I
VAPVTAGAVTTSLLIFFVVYNVLMLAFIWFAGRVALKGPADTSPPALEHPGIDRTNAGLFDSDTSAPAIGGAQQAGATS